MIDFSFPFPSPSNVVFTAEISFQLLKTLQPFDIVTVSFTGLVAEGIPVNAIIVRKRDDTSWSQVLKDFNDELPKAQMLNCMNSCYHILFILVLQMTATKYSS